MPQPGIVMHYQNFKRLQFVQDLENSLLDF